MNNSTNTSQSHTDRGGRTSLSGMLARGFFITLPLLLVGFVAVQIFLVIQEIVRPLLGILPGVVFEGRFGRLLGVCIIVILLLMLLGLLARTRTGKAIGRWLESTILDHVPFYGTFRGFTSSLAGRSDGQTLRPARITVDAPGLEQLGFIVEWHPDGKATVFLPSAPNPASGTVIIVEPSRIHELDVPVRAIFRCMGNWGEGTAALLEKAGGARTGVAGQGGTVQPVRCPQTGATNDPIQESRS